MSLSSEFLSSLNDFHVLHHGSEIQFEANNVLSSNKNNIPLSSLDQESLLRHAIWSWSFVDNSVPLPSIDELDSEKAMKHILIPALFLAAFKQAHQDDPSLAQFQLKTYDIDMLIYKSRFMYPYSCVSLSTHKSLHAEKSVKNAIHREIEALNKEFNELFDKNRSFDSYIHARSACYNHIHGLGGIKHSLFPKVFPENNGSKFIIKDVDLANRIQYVRNTIQHLGHEPKALIKLLADNICHFPFATKYKEGECVYNASVLYKLIPLILHNMDNPNTDKDIKIRKAYLSKSVTLLSDLSKLYENHIDFVKSTIKPLINHSVYQSNVQILESRLKETELILQNTENNIAVAPAALVRL